jgi:nucleoside-diphosphate-sugar epimerase
VRIATVRLPQVHDTRRAGLVSFVAEIARQRGFVGHVGEGTNHWAAAHVDDVARLYRLALEKNRTARYHAVGEEGVELRAIAAVLGRRLGLPVRSVPPSEAPLYFGWMAGLAGEDLTGSSQETRSALGWEPNGPSLLADLERFGE